MQFAVDVDALLKTKDASLRALKGLANIIDAAVVALDNALDPEEEEEDVLRGTNARVGASEGQTRVGASEGQTRVGASEGLGASEGQKQLKTFIMAQALIASMVHWTLNCNWRCMDKVLERVGTFVNENQSRLQDQDGLGTAEVDQIDHRLRIAEEQCRHKFVEQQSEWRASSITLRSVVATTIAVYSGCTIESVNEYSEFLIEVSCLARIREQESSVGTKPLLQQVQVLSTRV
jgi:hypothetical protein